MRYEDVFWKIISLSGYLLFFWSYKVYFHIYHLSIYILQQIQAAFFFLAK